MKINTVLKCLWWEREGEQNWMGRVNRGWLFSGKVKKEKIKEGKLSLVITKDVNYGMTGGLWRLLL